MSNITSVTHSTLSWTFPSFNKIKNKIWEAVSDSFKAIEAFFHRAYSSIKNYFFPAQAALVPAQNINPSESPVIDVSPAPLPPETITAISKATARQIIEIESILKKQAHIPLESKDIVQLHELCRVLDEDEKNSYWSMVTKVRINGNGSTEKAIEILGSLGDNNSITELSLLYTAECPNIEKCLPQNTLRTLRLINIYENACPILLQEKIASCTSLSHLSLNHTSLQCSLPNSLTKLEMDCEHVEDSFYGQLSHLPNLQEFHSYSPRRLSIENISGFASRLTHFSGCITLPCLTVATSDKLISLRIHSINNSSIFLSLPMLAHKSPHLQHLELEYNDKGGSPLHIQLGKYFKNLQSLTLKMACLPTDFFKSMPETLKELTLEAITSPGLWGPQPDLTPLGDLNFLTHFCFRAHAACELEAIKKWPPNLTHLSLDFSIFVQSDYIAQFLAILPAERPLPDTLERLSFGGERRYPEALHRLAQIRGNPKTIELLVKKSGFDVNGKSGDQITKASRLPADSTPLKVARLVPNNEENIQALIELGGHE